MDGYNCAHAHINRLSWDSIQVHVDEFFRLEISEIKMMIYKSALELSLAADLVHNLSMVVICEMDDGIKRLKNVVTTATTITKMTISRGEAVQKILLMTLKLRAYFVLIEWALFRKMIVRLNIRQSRNLHTHSHRHAAHIRNANTEKKRGRTK